MSALSFGGRSFGLGLQSNKRPGAYAALAQQAEADGFDVVTVSTISSSSPHCLRCSRSRRRPSGCVSDPHV